MSHTALSLLAFGTMLVTLLILLAVGVCLLYLVRKQGKKLRLLYRERQKFTEIMNTVPLKVSVWDSQTSQPIFCSKGFLDYFDLEQLQGLGHIVEQLSEEDGERLLTCWQNLLERHQDFELEFVLKLQNRVTKMKGIAVYQEDSNSFSLVLSCEDMSNYHAQRDIAQNLEKEVAYLREASRLTAIPMWIRDQEKKLVWVNQAYADGLETSVEDVLKKQLELVSDLSVKLAQEQKRVQWQKHEEVRVDLHAIIGGERRLFSFVEKKGGRPSKTKDLLFGFAYDQTEVESVSEELKHHLAAHREVLNKLDTAIAIYGADKRLKFFNPAYAKLWQLPAQWLETEPLITEILEHLRAARRLPEFVDFREYKNSRLDFFTSLIEAVEYSLHLPDGRSLRSVATPHPIGGVIFFMEDMTNHLVLERDYNTLLAVQDESLQNLSEAIAVFGADGCLRLSNPAYQKLWDIPPELLEKQLHINKIFDHKKQFFGPGKKSQNLIQSLIVKALSREESQGTLKRQDESYISYKFTPLPDGAVLSSYLDITDSAHIEQALRASNEALETADRLKSEFISNVTYQLRTPLNAILGFAEILNNQYFGSLNERQKEYADNIIESSQRLLALVNDILDLATIQAGHLALEYAVIDVGSLLRNVFDMTHEWGASQGLNVKLECPQELGEIQADPRRMKQALYNLVSNAIKFTPPGGRICLRGQREHSFVVLTVEDTGIGIPLSDRDRSERDVELAERKFALSGTGLGLTLVRSLIEIHGGYVNMQSVAGSGTRISCYLPLSAQKQLEQKRPQAIAGPTHKPASLPPISKPAARK